MKFTITVYTKFSKISANDFLDSMTKRYYKKPVWVTSPHDSVCVHGHTEWSVRNAANMLMKAIKMDTVNSVYSGMNHGDHLDCPNCGAPCTVDINSLSGGKVADMTCWYNTHEKHWECTECMYK